MRRLYGFLTNSCAHLYAQGGQIVWVEEIRNARRVLGRCDDRIFCRVDRLCTFLRSAEVGGSMDVQSLAMLIISALVIVYLFYALLRPEKF
jgi:K+-transporting ATPase KdpF subunit